MEGMNKMDRQPKLVYSDGESSLKTEMITSYLEEEKIELHKTRGHPAFAERFIRKFKDKLDKRKWNGAKKGKDQIQWIDFISEIMHTYKTKDVHSATGLTPKEVRKPRNDAKAKMSMTIKARKTRLYPELRVNDDVTTYAEEGYNWKSKHFTLVKTSLQQKKNLNKIRTKHIIKEKCTLLLVNWLEEILPYISR